MIILTIRSDQPMAEVGLYEDQNRLGYKKWQAHRQLSVTLHQTIEALLTAAHKDWHDLQGIVCFKGPGSFTGLRIGLSVGNALADSLGISIVSNRGKDWLAEGIGRLLKKGNEHIVVPEYGGEVFTTKPKK